MVLFDAEWISRISCILCLFAIQGYPTTTISVAWSTLANCCLHGVPTAVNNALGTHLRARVLVFGFRVKFPTSIDSTHSYLWVDGHELRLGVIS
ncbi:hypothetical protein K439DRAFT_1632762 [Ramaria rubella]|nr:hypothetical protein K439DRAFT_1632762 [Ramaria rubella]